MTSTIEEWSPEAAVAIKLCKKWAATVRAKIPCKVYLFGSAIYLAGDQFDDQQSDLDIVVVFESDLDATDRVDRLITLRDLKANLELELIPGLHRENCVDPGISVVPITKRELQANIHKSGARRFFDKNIFFDLSAEKQSISLPDAGVGTLPDETRQALEYAQKIRNQFLAVSANGIGGIEAFDSVDPLPKSLARVAAQLSPDAKDGEWYDTRHGLEHLWAELSRRRSETAQLRALYRKLSIRRGGRGRRQPLTDIDQLLLAEILHDLAAATPLESIVTWEIRFAGVSLTDTERDRLVAELRRLIPDFHILKVFSGSIVIRLRSSARSYETIQRLQEFEILAKFFSVESVQRSPPGDSVDLESFGLEAPIDRIATRISLWRPQSTDGMRVTESRLAGLLDEWLRADETFIRSTLFREALISDGARPIRVDFLLNLGANKQDTRIVIELVRVHNRAGFFYQLERALQLTLPTILVVIGPDRILDSIREDIDRLAQLNDQVRVVPVPFDKG